jgi:hypothetical protein
MIWAFLGGGLGVASKAHGAEDVISLLAGVLLVYSWSMYFYLKRQQAKRRRRSRNSL